MHLKNLKARPLLVAFVILMPCFLLSFALLSAPMTSPSINSQSSIVDTHVPAASDAANMEKQAGGAHQDGQNHGGITALDGIGIEPLAIWSGHH
jgi:hypothetical protein